MDTALFEPLGDDRYQPTDYARGPWSPDALHGGPPSALLAGAMAARAADLGVEWLPARTSVELWRPVPLTPLTVHTTIERPGRKVCVVAGSIRDGNGNTLAAGRLQGIRMADVDPGVGEEPASPPGPSEGVGMAPDQLVGPPGFHRSSVEHRFVKGSFAETGPATDWIRLTRPLVAGREPTPLERVVAVADFGNGISKRFQMGEAFFLNPDLTVVLHRLPSGDHVGLDAVTHFGPDGVGMAESTLFDVDGAIGRAVQTLLLERP